MKYLLMFISAMLLMVSCKSDDDKQPVKEKVKRTVFVYMAQRNDRWSCQHTVKRPHAHLC